MSCVKEPVLFQSTIHNNNLKQFTASLKLEVVHKEKKPTEKPKLQQNANFNPLSLPDEVEMQKFNIDFEHEVPQFLEETNTKSL